MEKRNILICLEKCGIGGVETVVLNQASVLLEMGHTVIVLAKRGIYAEILEKKGAICIDFEFPLDNSFNQIKINKLIEFINTFKIDEIYIHQFPCILSAFPAALMTNTPYVAYVHNGIGGVYEWFMKTYSIYKTAIPYYYKCAQKIITITEDVKEDIIKKFSVPGDKIKVIPNSISFENADEIRQEQENDKSEFLLITRFSKEKGNSINNAINIYCAYLKSNPNASLTIIGDGELEDEVKTYVKGKEIADSVTFLGETNDVLKEINKADVVLGLGRCILEAIIMKKLAIITGYDNPKQLITPENIIQAKNANFSGRNMKDTLLEDLIKQIEQLEKEQIDDIVCKNYIYAKEYLDINKNIYIIDNKNIVSNDTKQVLLDMLISTQEENASKDKEIEEHIKQQENKDQIIEEQITKVTDLDKKISQISSSKKWKHMSKLANFFH